VGSRLPRGQPKGNKELLDYAAHVQSCNKKNTWWVPEPFILVTIICVADCLADLRATRILVHEDSTGGAACKLLGTKRHFTSGKRNNQLRSQPRLCQRGAMYATSKSLVQSTAEGINNSRHAHASSTTCQLQQHLGPGHAPCM
jgi:hypothetical protein